MVRRLRARRSFGGQQIGVTRHPSGVDPAVQNTMGFAGYQQPHMPTKLDKTIRREIEIDGEPFTISISPAGFRLSKKRFRSGVALSWKSLWVRRGHDESSPSDSPEER